MWLNHYRIRKKCLHKQLAIIILRMLNKQSSIFLTDAKVTVLKVADLPIFITRIHECWAASVWRIYKNRSSKFSIPNNIKTVQMVGGNKLHPLH